MAIYTAMYTCIQQLQADTGVRTCMSDRILAELDFAMLNLIRSSSATPPETEESLAYYWSHLHDVHACR